MTHTKCTHGVSVKPMAGVMMTITILFAVMVSLPRFCYNSCPAFYFSHDGLLLQTAEIAVRALATIRLTGNVPPSPVGGISIAGTHVQTHLKLNRRIRVQH